MHVLPNFILGWLFLLRAVAGHGQQIVDIAEDLALQDTSSSYKHRLEALHQQSLSQKGVRPFWGGLSGSSQWSCHRNASSHKEIHISGSWRTRREDKEHRPTLVRTVWIYSQEIRILVNWKVIPLPATHNLAFSASSSSLSSLNWTTLPTCSSSNRTWKAHWQHKARTLAR